jgi:hypothetical protein
MSMAGKSILVVLASTLILSLASTTRSTFAAEGPVKVYILSGQSNMVGIGQVTGGQCHGS